MAWLFGCFVTVHTFRGENPPLCPSIELTKRLEVASGERKSRFCVYQTLLGRLLF